jgi:hypothetical protein
MLRVYRPRSRWPVPRRVVVSSPPSFCSPFAPSAVYDAVNKYFAIRAPPPFVRPRLYSKSSLTGCCSSASDWPSFFAFDPLEVGGEDLRDQPLAVRKRRLRQIVPRADSRLLYVDHLERRVSALFRAACARDLEGIVAKWRHGRYERDGVSTSWLKIKNPEYSQMARRHELFAGRHSPASRTIRRPVLHLRLT